MKPKLSLRFAIILPYLAVMLIMAFSVLMIWQSNYQFLADQQGARIVGALSNHTNEKINAFIGEPHRLNAVFANTLGQLEVNTLADIERNQRFCLDFISAQRGKLPQISVASYGDEISRYMGYRVNEDGTFSLMRKDEGTNQMLNIYAGESVDTEVLAAYEGYDPRVRPWYAPAKSNPVPQWSEIYINADEKSESTISTIAPIISEGGRFTGVAELDVKLDGIHRFLNADETRGNGLIYIVDKDWRLVAQSGTTETMKIIPGDTPTAELLAATESEDLQISQSANVLRKSAKGFNTVSRVNMADKPYFLLANEVDPALNLGWKVVVAIPESDIMGSVQANLQLSSMIMFGIIVVGTLLGIFVMNRVTQPILSVAHGANDLSQGKWGIELPLNKRPLAETHELVTAFNRMSHQIKENLDQINQLHNQEKLVLETAVAERTAELELTMQELISREKLASLGSLVSGISHEINTPLGVSVTAASFMDEANERMKHLMRDNAITKNDFVRYVETMEESVTILNTNLVRAAELIKSFKEIAVNQSTEELISFNVREYIQTIITSLKHEYKHTEHKFDIQCDSGLIVTSYPGAWSQILTNFIINSLRHGFSKRDQGTMRIEVFLEGQDIVMVYSDNGRGIDAAHQKHVFDPFYTTSRGDGGSGLGLSIVYNLVTGLLKGKISLESEVEKGVKFVITMPLNDDSKRN